jgi:Prolipoprotein diacylglyceryl transferase
VTRALLAGLPRMEIRVLGRRLPSYQVCGGTGVVASLALASGLAWRLGRSPLVVLACATAAVITSLALALATKAIVQEEHLTFYHHAIAIVAVSALLLAGLRQPVLGYLDLVALGLGAVLAVGRVGCLLAGCCYGRPNRWGVRYGAEHVDEGFPSHLAGVRVAPVQAAESLLALILVAGGVDLALGGAPQGTVLALSAAGYALGRFLLELLRGDPERPYAAAFSEAQWTSLLVSASVAGMALAGLVPRPWAAAPAPVILAMAVVAVTGLIGAGRVRPLLRPRHVQELAHAAEVASALELEDGTVPVVRTSRGVQLSAGRIDAGGGPLHHYALSVADGVLPHAGAVSLARLVVDLRHPGARHELVSAGHGVYHLLVHAEALLHRTDAAGS